MAQLKRWLIGAPLATDLAQEQKLSRPKALAIFASDALSSNAYATEEILLVLVTAGAAAISGSIPLWIAAAIIGLLALLVTSYRQTIAKYPAGGGAYNVARDNLGETPGLVAGASLLVDYTLTVAVSSAAGVYAIVSAAPGLLPYRVELCLAAVVLIALMNLRGTRESGNVFAVPPYLFILSVFALVGYGLFTLFTTGRPPHPEGLAQVDEVVAAAEPLTWFLILKAFSSGCTALTGVEAISNGVPNFRKPAADNARATLLTLGILASLMFGGLTLLAQQLHVIPDESGGRSVLSLINAGVFGYGSPMFWFVQVSTMAILLLAANTAFNGFPLLASLMARDGYLPRQFNNVGDRLVYSNGIVILAAGAATLLVVFGGVVTNLIPLYAIGVFASFTLSQSGMVKRWITRREPGWRQGLAVSGLGGILSFVVMCVFAVTKFSGGAWVVLIIVPLLVLALSSIKRHYISTAEQLSLASGRPPARLRRNQVIVPVGTLHKGVARALDYARTLSPDVKAVYAEVNPEDTERLRRKWAEFGHGVELEILPSPYRSTTRPLFDYIRDHDTGRRDEVITVVIPEFLPAHWWQGILHNQTALALKGALLFRRNTIVVSVPFHLDD